MINTQTRRWVAGATLGLAMAASMAGVGSASAASITADLSSGSSVAAVAGTTITITGSSFGADEPVGFWINIPDGTSIDADSLGQSDSYVAGTVIPLDDMGYADDAGDPLTPWTPVGFRRAAIPWSHMACRPK